MGSTSFKNLMSQVIQHDLTMFQRACCDVRLSDYFQLYMENITDFLCGLRLLDPTVFKFALHSIEQGSCDKYF
ncbi:hypothetical protein LDENG_00085890 [Lucifuga dentata]|nr:hypothetical protein LDENG_00085890 [Lucifuga dentata]